MCAAHRPPGRRLRRRLLARRPARDRPARAARRRGRDRRQGAVRRRVHPAPRRWPRSRRSRRGARPRRSAAATASPASCRDRGPADLLRRAVGGRRRLLPRGRRRSLGARVRARRRPSTARCATSATPTRRPSRRSASYAVRSSRPGSASPTSCAPGCTCRHGPRGRTSPARTRSSSTRPSGRDDGRDRGLRRPADARRGRGRRLPRLSRAATLATGFLTGLGYAEPHQIGSART